MKYKQNLHIESDKVISYTTHVATIDRTRGKLYVHGYWSQTTSKHINHVADIYGLTKEDAKLDPERDGALAAVALVAKFGGIFGKTEKEANDWKKRMLTAGLEKQGLDFPDDWDALPETEKKKRLDGAIAQID